MLHYPTVRQLRTGAWTTAAFGLVCAYAFFASSPDRWSFIDSIAGDILPYFAMAAAIALGRTRLVASFLLIASVLIVAVGVSTYIDLLRSQGINDIELLTVPLKWLLTLLSLAVAVLSFAVRRTGPS